MTLTTPRRALEVPPAAAGSPCVRYAAVARDDYAWTDGVNDITSCFIAGAGGHWRVDVVMTALGPRASRRLEVRASALQPVASLRWR